MIKKDELMPTSNAHPRTGAKFTATPESATRRAAPTVQQVLAQQKAPPTQRAATFAQSPAGPLSAVAEPQLPVPTNGSAVAVNEGKLDAWSAAPLVSINFNGNTGEYSAFDGSNVLDREFVAFMPRVTEGYTKFHGKGERPDVVESCLGDGTPRVTRDELGDLDQSKWEYGLDNQPRDPWQKHMSLPLIACDDSGEIFQLVPRSPLARSSMEQLLGKYKYSPNRHLGLLPVIKLGVRTKYIKRFKTDKPVPVLGITRWVTPDGKPKDQAAQSKAVSAEMDDEIGL
jgi:hypothetical protein